MQCPYFSDTQFIVELKLSLPQHFTIPLSLCKTVSVINLFTGQQAGDGEEAAFSDQRESVMSEAAGSRRGAQKGKDSVR